MIGPANTPPGWEQESRYWEWPEDLVRGESRHQAALHLLAGRPGNKGARRPVAVDLVREPWNPHDRSALRAEVAGQIVGHMAREVAAEIAGEVDAAGLAGFSVCGLIVGGSTGAPSLGVHLWLHRRLSEGPDWEGNMLAWKILYGRAEVRRKGGKLRDAEATYFRAIDAVEHLREGPAPAPYEALAKLLYHAGRDDDALAVLDRYLVRAMGAGRDVTRTSLLRGRLAGGDFRRLPRGRA